MKSQANLWGGVIIVISLFFLFSPNAVFAATYYVDATGGSNSNNGTDSSTPWQTIAKVNGSSFSPGDSILFKKGETWREQLTAPSSGTSGNPVTFGAYGSGADPVINGSNVVSSWSDNSVGTYDFQWDMENISASPWGFTHITDTGSKLSRSASAAHNGSFGLRLTGGGGTTEATTNKTGLSYPSSVYASFYLKPSSDIAFNGGRIFDIRYPGDSFASIRLENSNQLILARNKPSFANIGSAYTITTGAWHFVEFIATGIGTSNGVVTMKVDGTTRATASSINFSAGYTISEAHWGITGAFGSGMTAGTLDFDDGFVDADGATSGGVANTWSASATTEPKIVLFDGVRGTTVASVAAVNDPREWYWNSNLLYTYGAINPSSTYTTIEAGNRNFSVLNDTHDYVTFQNLDLRNTNQFGIRIQNSNHITFDSNSISQVYFQGNDINNGGGQSSNYLTFSNNTISQCGSTGISIAGDADQVGNITISGNTVHDCGWNTLNDGYTTYNAGIKAWGGANIGSAGESDNILIENNLVYNQADQFGDYSGTGIWLDQWGDNAVIKNNLVHGNAAYGIIVENPLSTGAAQVHHNIVYGNNKGISANRNASNVSVFNNTIYGNTLGGLINEGVGIQKTMQNNLFKNNISTGNGTQLVAILGGENANGGSGNIYLNNAFGPESSNFIEWGSGIYKSTYAAFDSAYGGLTHSVSGDPLFTNVGLANFSLLSSSPAIDTGLNLGSTYQSGLDPVSSWPSSISTLNQNTNGTGWDIGAYVFSNPIAVSTTPSSQGSSNKSGSRQNISPLLAPGILPVSSPLPSSSITQKLWIGQRNPQVKLLQQFLNTHGFILTTTGLGSPGRETDLFGNLTKSAVTRFQEYYANDILLPQQLTKGTGIVGEGTLKKIGEVMAH